MLAFPRNQIPPHINLEQPVGLPTDIIIPQLASARVTMLLATVLDAIPAEILSPTRPDPGATTVTLPLHEIVSQLPPRFFTARLSQRTVSEIGADIPAPFQERKPVPPPRPVMPIAEEAPVVVPPPKPIFTPQPVQAVAPPPAPKPVIPQPEPTPAAPPPPSPVITSPAMAPTPVAGEPMAPPEPKPVTPPPPPPACVEPPTPAPAPVVIEAPAPPMEPVIEPVAVAPATPVAPPPPEPTAPATVEVAASTEPAPTDEKKYLINLNRCSVEDLLAIKGVGPSLAQRIIAWRAEHGRFNSLDELRDVPGVGRKTLRALTGARPGALNRLLGVTDDRELTLQEIVRLTSKLPGLQGCMLATADGLLLTGEVPPHLDKEAISVFAPQLFRRVARYTKELKVGQVQRFTLFTDQLPVSIFGAEDVFLVVLHDSKHFSKRLLRLCERISLEIARLCRQRTTV